MVLPVKLFCFLVEWNKCIEKDYCYVDDDINTWHYKWSSLFYCSNIIDHNKYSPPAPGHQLIITYLCSGLWTFTGAINQSG